MLVCFSREASVILFSCPFRRRFWILSKFHNVSEFARSSLRVHPGSTQKTYVGLDSGDWERFWHLFWNPHQFHNVENFFSRWTFLIRSYCFWNVLPHTMIFENWNLSTGLRDVVKLMSISKEVSEWSCVRVLGRSRMNSGGDQANSETL